MKRFLFVAVAVATVMLAGCSNDDESGSGDLVGKWEAITDYELVNGEWEELYTYEPEESIIVFTATHYTVYDKNDLGNGLSVKYTYDAASGKIIVAGLLEIKVYKLTATGLEMGGEFLIGEGEEKTAYKKIE